LQLRGRLGLSEPLNVPLAQVGSNSGVLSQRGWHCIFNENAAKWDLVAKWRPGREYMTANFSPKLIERGTVTASRSIFFVLICVSLVQYKVHVLAEKVSAEEVFYVTVEAGDHDRLGTQLSIPLPKVFHPFPRIGLCRSDDRVFVAGQVIDDSAFDNKEVENFENKGVENKGADKTAAGQGKRLVWQLAKKLAKGTSRTYEILPLSKEQEFVGDRIVCEHKDGKLNVRIGDVSVLDYNVATQEPPEGLPSYYRRSGYIHPLYSPSGKVVTGDFSKGHVHQHALFFAWTKAKFEGRSVEFWNQKLELGLVEHVKVIGAEGGSVVGRFQVELRHSGLNEGQTTPILDEHWDVSIANRKDIFVIDLETTQKCVTNSPLTVEKYHYGGMAIRGTSQWEIADGKPQGVGMLTSAGADRLKGNHSRPNWVALFGKIAGEMNGVAALSHPMNFRAPQFVRLHPARPYFCFSPMVEEEFAIAPGKPFRARYRFIVYTGETDVEKLQSLWTDFAEPPKLKLVELEE
jgi:hypothetical protein